MHEGVSMCTFALSRVLGHAHKHDSRVCVCCAQREGLMQGAVDAGVWCNTGVSVGAWPMADAGRLTAMRACAGRHLLPLHCQLQWSRRGCEAPVRAGRREADDDDQQSGCLGVGVCS